MTTTFEAKCEILAELWLDYKGNPQFEDFIYYNDLGLPLAYAITTEIVSSSAKAQVFIEETFVLLLEAMGKTDEGFDSLDDLLGLTE
jgi:hypothetical protein